MNSPSFDDVLDRALAMQAEGASLAECLARFPQHANELAPLLEAASLARAGLDAPIPKPNLARGRARLLAAARPRPAATLVVRLALALTLAVLVFTFGGVTLTVASASALPGDALYPVKLNLERLELAITFDPAERQRLQAAQAAQRRADAQAAAQQRREVRVTFDGVVDERRAGTIIVSGVAVRSNAADLQAGDRVQIDARIENGVIIADRIDVLHRPDATPPPAGARPTPEPDPSRPAGQSPTVPVDSAATHAPSDVRPTPSATATRSRPVTAADTRPSQPPADARPTYTASPTAEARTPDSRPTPAPDRRP